MALAIFHETTIAACKSYYPERADMSSFLQLISTWWKIANSRKRFTPNFLSNAIKLRDGKINFYEEFAVWLESWSSPAFCLSKETSDGLVTTLKAQAMLITEY